MSQKIHLLKYMNEGLAEAGCDKAGTGPLAWPVHDATPKETASPEALESFRTVKWFFDCNDALLGYNVGLYMLMSGKKIKNDLRFSIHTETFQ